MLQKLILDAVAMEVEAGVEEVQLGPISTTSVAI
jgi:hypothetical protein